MRSKTTLLYKLFDEKGELLYVGITGDWETRRKAHKATKSWFNQIARVEFEQCAGAQAAAEREVIVIAQDAPVYNIRTSMLLPKSNMARTALTIRLSDETLAMLDELAARDDQTRTAVITLLVRREAERRGIYIPGTHGSNVSPTENVNGEE